MDHPHALSGFMPRLGGYGKHSGTAEFQRFRHAEHTGLGTSGQSRRRTEAVRYGLARRKHVYPDQARRSGHVCVWRDGAVLAAHRPYPCRRSIRHRAPLVPQARLSGHFRAQCDRHRRQDSRQGRRGRPAVVGTRLPLRTRVQPGLLRSGRAAADRRTASDRAYGRYDRHDPAHHR